MKAVKWFALVLVVLLSALGAAGCMSDDGGESATPTAGETGTTSQSDTAEEAEGDGIATGEVSTVSPAADLRVTLDRLLGEHAMLAMFSTQKGFAGDKDFKAIAAALDRNSVDLADAIGSVYGEEAREEFLNGNLKWRDHIKFFVNYTVGLAKNDKAMQRQAANDLKGYTGSFSGFLAQATGLPADAVEESISMHVAGLTDQINAYSRENYADGYEHVRNAYAHMFETGDTLSGAIVEQSPDEFPTENATTAAVDLRVTLGRLLGEHAMLAMLSTQKGFSGDADFEAIAGALDRNSVELADAIGSVYGDEAREEFLNGKSKWRDHIKFFVNYTVGLAKNDKAMQRDAVKDLQGYIGSFSGFLAEATGLPAEAVEEAITEHVNQLKGQIDAYAKGNYAQAYDIARDAYAHMYMTGDTLAGAIVKQSPDEFST